MSTFEPCAYPNDPAGAFAEHDHDACLDAVPDSHPICTGRPSYLYAEHRHPVAAAVMVRIEGANALAYCRECYRGSFHVSPTPGHEEPIPAHELHALEPEWTAATVDPGTTDTEAPRIYRRPWTSYDGAPIRIPERVSGAERLPFAVILRAGEPYDLASLADAAELRTNSRRTGGDLYRIARACHYAREEATQTRYTTSRSRDEARGEMNAYGSAAATLSGIMHLPVTFLAAVLADGGAYVSDRA